MAADQFADNLSIAFLAARLGLSLPWAAKKYAELGPAGKGFRDMASMLRKLDVPKAEKAQLLPIVRKHDNLPKFLRLAWLAHKDQVTLATALKRYGGEPVSGFWAQLADAVSREAK